MDASISITFLISLAREYQASTIHLNYIDYCKMRGIVSEKSIMWDDKGEYLVLTPFTVLRPDPKEKLQYRYTLNYTNPMRPVVDDTETD